MWWVLGAVLVLVFSWCWFIKTLFNELALQLWRRKR